MNYCSYFMALKDAKWVLNQGLARSTITGDDSKLSTAGSEDTCLVQLSLLPRDKFSEHSRGCLSQVR